VTRDDWGPPWRDRRRGRLDHRRRRRSWLLLPLAWIWLAILWGGAGWLWRQGTLAAAGRLGHLVPFGFLAAATIAAAVFTALFSHRLQSLRLGVETLNLRTLDVRVPVEGRGAVADLAQSFNRMVDRLAAEERVRRQLFADVAHELRHPLAVLKGRLEALQDGVLPLEQAEILHLQDMVIGLSRLVDDVRDLSLADVGQLSLTLTPTDLGALVQEVSESLGPLAEDRTIALSVETPPLAPVTADRDRLRQVLVNLVTNALRYTPAGGSVGTATRDSGPDAVIEVWDTGPGIDPGSQDRIFDRFYRGDQARSRATGGSGLGLAIVRSLVELHGGSVSVRSPDGPAGGSRFIVRLPRRPSGDVERLRPRTLT
jgi:two-component system, OmpR family, sensor histidine kinase BaeS